MSLRNVVPTLLRSKEPSVRWKVRVHVLGEPRDSSEVQALERTIRRSRRVHTLLAHRGTHRTMGPARDPYSKWQGIHWVLATLADIGYPRGDKTLLPLRDRLLDRWLSDAYYREFEATTKSQAYARPGVPRVRGRYRRCASQQGNALYFLEKLGIADERSAALVERLLHWQWPDGGWNCDRNPGADTSSFWETRHAMSGLALYAERTKDAAARKAALRASEVFLSRDLFLERHTGRVMNPEFLQLHYPLYYHYDVLGGLRSMVELGRIRDPRCGKALDVLESKQLPGGGWPAERQLYKVSDAGTRTDSVDWGGASRTAMNEWVTADALSVLKASGRL